MRMVDIPISPSRYKVTFTHTMHSNGRHESAYVHTFSLLDSPIASVVTDKAYPNTCRLLSRQQHSTKYQTKNQNFPQGEQSNLLFSDKFSFCFPSFLEGHQPHTLHCPGTMALCTLSIVSNPNRICLRCLLELERFVSVRRRCVYECPHSKQPTDV